MIRAQRQIAKINYGLMYLRGVLNRTLSENNDPEQDSGFGRLLCERHEAVKNPARPVTYLRSCAGPAVIRPVYLCSSSDSGRPMPKSASSPSDAIPLPALDE